MSLRPKKINFDKLFTEFESDLEKIYNFSGLDRVSGMNMFQSVYDMCTATPKPYTEKLFCSIAYFLEEYTMRKKRNILDRDDIIKAYAEEWNRYSQASIYISRICDYLNRIMLKNKDTGGIPASERRKTVGDGKYRRQTIQALAYLVWKERVVDFIKIRLMYQIFEMIRRDRDGEGDVPGVVTEAIQSLGILNSLTDHPLRLYIEEFEIPYLKHTKQYYEREAIITISSATISEYMEKACQRLKQETARNSKYCHVSSHDTMIKECEKQYVAVHQSRIHNEFEAMISNERYNDCSMAYYLLSRITDGVNPLLETFERYITQIGKDLISRKLSNQLVTTKNELESSQKEERKKPNKIDAINDLIQQLTTLKIENKIDDLDNLVQKFNALKIEGGNKGLISKKLSQLITTKKELELSQKEERRKQDEINDLTPGITTVEIDVDDKDSETKKSDEINGFTQKFATLKIEDDNKDSEIRKQKDKTDGLKKSYEKLIDDLIQQLKIEDGNKDSETRKQKEKIDELKKSQEDRMGTGTLKDPRDYVEPLMSLHSKYMNVCQKVFSSDPAFIAAVDKAFRRIENDPSMNTAAPEVLARYCDVLLKKNQKSGISEQDIEDKMNNMVDDKDVYQKFYSRLLAKRLIYGSSVSDEAEANMISRLKTICGVEYTSKLQRMFTDITVSADINSSFSEYLKAKPLNLGVDFTILVLTAGAWPLTQVSTTDFQLPLELEKSVSYFESFYNEHHSGRKLTWLWHLSKADVKLGYLDKRYEFSVSLYQLGVLLLFNAVDMLTFKEISEHTRLNEQELKRVLKPLIDLAALIITPTGSLKESTEIKLNMEFSNKRTKIKISSSLQSDSPQENDATRRAVDEDRKLYLQASIVRVMKSRQMLVHNRLVQEVIDQAKSRFTPSVPMIKKCIEQLLDKQYIKRSVENRDKYVYIA
ncbi:9200_t:CDS:10 [Ambispora leptoticha]|uniref:9200_t:CDS:1 n=1 Tax=Ambispora leptoticha TaxID=144679 RepID=A0A9N8VPD3_9GLOM|nr:9200_t:CDS:10 [Ambispora leptoticha]